MKISHFLLVFAGSGLGGIVRIFISGRLFPHSHFPFGTLAVNILACFLAGFFWAHPQVSHPVNPSRQLLLISGFCGGFSTFSAFGLDLLSLQQKGMPGLSLAYLFLSLASCMLAVWAGFRLQQIL
jgi:CrcB protein